MRASTGHACAPRGELDRFEDRHRPTELAVLDGRVEAELERHDQEVRGHEHRVLGARDAKRCVEDHRIELAVGERDEEPRLAGSALGIALSPGSPHERSSSRSARWATTRMSMPGSSRIIRETQRAARDLDPAALVGRADEDVGGAALGGDAPHGRRRGRLPPPRGSGRRGSRRAAGVRRAASPPRGRAACPGRRIHERVDLAAEALRRPPRAAKHALRAWLWLDEREHTLADRLLAQRIENRQCRAGPPRPPRPRAARARGAPRGCPGGRSSAAPAPPARPDRPFRRGGGPGAPRVRCRRG